MVKQSSVEGAELGLFDDDIFEENEILTVYFFPRKSKTFSTSIYIFTQGVWYCTVPVFETLQVQCYMVAYFINGATWNCKESEEKNLG